MKHSFLFIRNTIVSDKQFNINMCKTHSCIRVSFIYNNTIQYVSLYQNIKSENLGNNFTLLYHHLENNLVEITENEYIKGVKDYLMRNYKTNVENILQITKEQYVIAN